MTWRGEHYESDSGGPKHRRLAPFSIQASPAASAWTWAFEIIGTAAKSKASKVFPGGNRASSRWRSKRRRFRSTISCSPSAARKRAAGQPSLSAVAARAAQIILMPGSRNSPSISSMRAASILSIAFMPRLPCWWRSGRRWRGTEAFDHRRKVRQDALVEIGLQREREFGLAAALVRERKNPHHDAAGRPLTETREQGLERQSEHPAREELVAIDQVEQRHRLAAQRMDDVTIIDDMAMSAARLGAAAPQGENRRRALKAFEPIIVQMHPQPLADQSRGNRVEHFAQDEGAGAGDVDMDLLVVGGLAERQLFQRESLLLDTLGVAGVAAADDLVDEAPPCRQRLEVARGSQQEGVIELTLE